ncbi:transmembrane protein PMIS2 [Manis javanica]|uniref:transmembrane protein PMIS2 n=1 Tax=Manis javanica TaxID=9974 RepID=UPI003C6CE06B
MRLLFPTHSTKNFLTPGLSSPQKLPELPKLSQHLQQPHQPQAPHQPAPGAPPAPGASPEAPKGDAKPIQTPEELTFHATNDLYLTVMAVLFFPPLGLLAVFFCHKTWKANRNSKWEDAYINSGRTVWMDVFSILISLGLIYAYALYL